MWQSDNVWQCDKVTMWRGFCTRTYLNALFVETLNYFPLVLSDDTGLLHVAEGGEPFLHLSRWAKVRIYSHWSFAPEQSGVDDVSKRSSKELRVVENWHCVLAMARERRTSKAARYIIRLDSFWKSFEIFTFFLGSPLLLGKYLNAGHPQALYERNDQVTSNCSSHQASPGYFANFHSFVNIDFYLEVPPFIVALYTSWNKEAAWIRPGDDFVLTPPPGVSICFCTDPTTTIYIVYL